MNRWKEGEEVKGETRKRPDADVESDVEDVEGVEGVEDVEDVEDALTMKLFPLRL